MVMEGMKSFAAKWFVRFWVVALLAFCATARGQVSCQFSTLAGSVGKYGAVDGTGAAARFSYSLSRDHAGGFCGTSRARRWHRCSREVRRVLIRGAGPALQARFGMNGVLAEPRLTLSNHAGKTLEVAGAWSEQLNANEIRDAAKREGAFAFDDGSADSALVVTLLPGLYTVQVAGSDGGSGVALVEVYDLP
jgi:hypothetical protein